MIATLCGTPIDNLTTIAQKEGVTEECVGLDLRGDGNFDCDAWLNIIAHLQNKLRKSVYFIQSAN